MAGNIKARHAGEARFGTVVTHPYARRTTEAVSLIDPQYPGRSGELKNFNAERAVVRVLVLVRLSLAYRVIGEDMLNCITLIAGSAGSAACRLADVAVTRRS